MRALLLAMLLVAAAGCASMTMVRVPVTCTNGAPVAQGDAVTESRGLLQRLREAVRPPNSAKRR